MDEREIQTESLLNKFNLWRRDHISERQFILLLSLVVGIFTAFAALLLKYLISLIHGFISDHLFISQENYSLPMKPRLLIFAKTQREEIRPMFGPSGVSMVQRRP